MTTKALFPNIAPSLSLDFARVKALDPRITFSRASTGRFFDGKTVAKAEENLLTNSQAVAVYAATGISTRTNNVAVAPDGTSTAASIIENSATSEHFLTIPTVSYVAGESYTFSCFVKPNGRNFFRLSYPSQAFPSAERFAYFDVQNGVLGTVAPNITATITPAGNGWYRCSISRAATNSASATGFLVICEVDDATTYTGDGTSGLFLWGAQLEQRSAVTAYTPTTTQPITNYVPVLLSAANDVARFDHNPVTGESLGLLIEEQRTNLLLRSEEFDDASWTKTNATVTANTIVAPDGTLSAEKLITNSGSTGGNVNAAVTVTGVPHTFSVYAKAGEVSLLRLVQGNTILAAFELTTQVVSIVSGTSASIVDAGNGWYRCSVVTTPEAGSRTYRIFGRTSVETGDGFSGIYIWGAQLEAGAFPTSYIPTVASQVTRSADAASMTGANFSSWYRADEGTFYADYVSASGNSSQQVFFAAGTSGNNIQFLADNSASTGGGADVTRIRIQVNGSDQCNINLANPVSRSTPYKGVVAYAVDDIAGSLNAGTVLTDTSALIPVVDTLNIGGSNLSSTIKKLAYYPKRLANAELQALTQI